LQIEEEGINRAHSEAALADLMLLVIDATYYQEFNRKYPNKTFTDFVELQVEQLKLRESVSSCRNIENLLNHQNSGGETNNMCLLIFNKLDLIEDKTLFNKICDENPTCVTAISCTNNDHLETLMEKLSMCLKEL
jgi:tRNA U34 5-carboxymethylaminomethyl modifying GTPase MnmE/TrmE